MSTNTSRRSLITTAAVAALAPAIPAASMAALPVVPLAAPETIPEDWVTRLKPQFDRALKMWLRLCALNNSDVWKLDGDLHLWSALHDVINPIMHEISEQKATTRAGMALQAEAFAVNNTDCFADSYEDPYERYVSGFVTSVCAFLGTSSDGLILCQCTNGRTQK
jgi:hypothetical protein